MKQDIQIFLLGIQNAGSEPEAILTNKTGTYFLYLLEQKCG